MKKLSTILRETNIPKITGQYILFHNRKLVGKCAMGVISCEVGLTLDYNIREYPLSKILIHANVPGYLIDTYLPYVSINQWGKPDHPKYTEAEGTLGHIITHYNDTGKFTFKEIADYLEVTFDL